MKSKKSVFHADHTAMHSTSNLVHLDSKRDERTWLNFVSLALDHVVCNADYYCSSTGSHYLIPVEPTSYSHL